MYLGMFQGTSPGGRGIDWRTVPGGRGMDRGISPDTYLGMGIDPRPILPGPIPSELLRENTIGWAGPAAHVSIFHDLDVLDVGVS